MVIWEQEMENEEYIKNKISQFIRGDGQGEEGEERKCVVNDNHWSSLRCGRGALL